MIRKSPDVAVIVFTAPFPLKSLVVMGTSEQSRCWVAEARVGPNLGGCVREELIRGEDGGGCSHDSSNCSPISLGLGKKSRWRLLKSPTLGVGAKEGSPPPFAWLLSVQ